MASTKEKIIQVVDNNKTMLINGALVVGGIYLTYRLGKNIIASLNKSDEIAAKESATNCGFTIFSR